MVWKKEVVLYILSLWPRSGLNCCGLISITVWMYMLKQAERIPWVSQHVSCSCWHCFVNKLRNVTRNWPVLIWKGFQSPAWHHTVIGLSSLLLCCTSFVFVYLVTGVCVVEIVRSYRTLSEKNVLLCCYWTWGSCRGRYSDFSESCFETTDVSATPSGPVHCEEVKAVTWLRPRSGDDTHHPESPVIWPTRSCDSLDLFTVKKRLSFQSMTFLSCQRDYRSFFCENGNSVHDTFQARLPIYKCSHLFYIRNEPFYLLFTKKYPQTYSIYCVMCI